MLGRIVGTVVVLLVAAALAVLAWPQLLGLQDAPFISQALALRGATAAVAFIAGLLLALLAVLLRPIRGLLAGLAVVTLCFVIAQIAVIGTRGAFGTGMPTPAPASITVLAWNTLGETPSAADVADLVADTGAQVVALPETGADRAAEIVADLAARGLTMQSFSVAYDTIAKANSTTLLIAAELGPYAVDPTVRTTQNRPTLVATPVDGSGPTIVAAHTTAPATEEHQGDWRADLDWIAERCGTPDLIVAGDLNSTVDHWAGLEDPAVPGAQIGGCADAAIATGSGAIGTWPTAAPALLGAPIDHVLTGAAWRTAGFRVIGSEDGSGSDHRPVLAQLVPAAG